MNFRPLQIEREGPRVAASKTQRFARGPRGLVRKPFKLVPELFKVVLEPFKLVPEPFFKLVPEPFKFVPELFRAIGNLGSPPHQSYGPKCFGVVPKNYFHFLHSGPLDFMETKL